MPETIQAPTARPGVIEWQHLDKRRYYIAGPALNLATNLLLYPSKLIKIRLQVDAAKQYTGTIDAIIKTVRHEGPLALYKGFGPNLLSILSSQIYITTYEYSKSALRPYAEAESARNLAAGILASCTSQCLTVPADIVSQHLMVDQRVSKQGSTAAAQNSARYHIKNIWAANGAMGFFKGYSVSLLTHAPASGIFWVLYGKFRRLQIKRQEDGHEPGFLERAAGQCVASLVAGGLSGVVTNPLDVIKTNVQLQRKSARVVTADMFREEGLGWMTRGMVARVTHMGLNSAILVVAYEGVKYFSVFQKPA